MTPESREVRCKDDPNANGRVPEPGDQRFTLTFPLEDGSSLLVHMGREGLNTFATFIGNLMVDESSEEPPRDKDAAVWCFVCDRPKYDCGCVESGGNY